MGVAVVNILDANDKELIRISKEGLLALNLEEMKAIQAHHRKMGRNPTDVEMETYGQTWSTHCSHKDMKAKYICDITFHEEPQDLLTNTIKRMDPNLQIEYDDLDNTWTYKFTIENLLKDTVFRATQDIREKLGKYDFVVDPAFKDNAGFITTRPVESYRGVPGKIRKFWHKIKKYAQLVFAFKGETHNHPSAKEPKGGAETGIGGVIRDILAAGLGFIPILNTDTFCFANPNYPRNKVPEGVIHPKTLLKGVVTGVRDYGNPMGIPTVNGSVVFDDRYLGNCLVYCITGGVAPEKINGELVTQKETHVGNYIVSIGAGTGRDGIHGVTFASLEMDKDTESSPVQIGNPIEQKKWADLLLKARDKGWITFVQDCGGGGFSSAIGEIAEELGCVVDLEKAPLKYEGLVAWEIWVSEAQERQIVSVKPEYWEEFKALFESEDVEATKLGEFTGDKKLHLKYNGKTVGYIDVDFLHNGIPKVEKIVKYTVPKIRKVELEMNDDLGDDLKRVLGTWNVCSKEWIVKQYDHSVQSRTTNSPLQGVMNDGPGDASTLKLDLKQKLGVTVSNGICPKYANLNPFLMAASAIDEAVRNNTAAGGNPRHLELLDNFCLPDSEDPEELGKLVLMCLACYAVPTTYLTPFTSGKDSFNNRYVTEDGTVINIPPTLLISAASIVQDVRKERATIHVKSPGDLVYVIGETRDELGGSEYLKVKEVEDGRAPGIDPEKFIKIYKALNKAIKKGYVKASHDCSDGGIGVAAAEMAFAGGYGMDLDISKIKHDPSINREDVLLFSESNGRLIVEVDPKYRKKFEKVMRDCAVSYIGQVTDTYQFVVRGFNNHIVINEHIADLKQAWITPMDYDHRADELMKSKEYAVRGVNT
jgi:phosphoribosylformylglycinamidine synthase